MSLVQTIEDYIKENNLSTKKLAIACSAGIDSMVLLSVLQEKKELDIVCFHLDHGLRQDSYKAKDFLELYCQKNEIRFLAKTLLAGELADDENSARKARYSFFEKEAKINGIEDILLAHNLNDQAETILFRLARGTNTNGLQGIPQKRKQGDLTIHRPLLNISRKEIEAYQSEKNLEFIEDSSNAKDDYNRNHLRLNVLPQLERINPKYLENLFSISQLVSEEQIYFDNEVSSNLDKLGSMPWSLEELRKLNRTILRKVLEKSFTTNIAFINQFLEAIELGGFHKINFSRDRFFLIKQKELSLLEEKQPY